MRKGRCYVSIVINTAQPINISLAPKTIEEEVLQNIWTLLSSLEYDVPLDCKFGINGDFIDKPIQTAKALVVSEIYEKIEQYEPRAEIIDITFATSDEEAMQGILKPIVEVKINAEYNTENNS